MTFVQRIFLKLNIINQMICHLRNPVQAINCIIYFTTRAISREGILSFFDNEKKYYSSIQKRRDANRIRTNATQFSHDLEISWWRFIDVVMSCSCHNSEQVFLL